MTSFLTTSILAILTVFTLQVKAADSFKRSPEPLVRLAEQEWNKTAVDNTQIGTLPSTTTATYRLPLTVVRDQKSPWTWEMVIPYIRKAEELFQQCDVQISPITLVELSHPALADFTPSTDYLITGDLPHAEAYRPMAIFNGGTNGYVYSNADYYKSHIHPEMSRHTVFIDYWALAFLGTKASKDYFTGVLVHELLHTLLNVGHNQIPGNILNNTPSMGHQISADQCSDLLKSPLLRKNP